MSEEIRNAVIDLADKYLFPYEVKHKSHGDELVPEFCPFCNGGSNQHDKKTFAVSLENGCFVCKRGSCGQRGNFDALAEYFHENIRLNHKNHENTANVSKTYALPAVKMLPPTEKIYQYFESRKISRETVDAFKVGADDRGNIVFPFYENGENVFVKFRKPQKHTPEDRSPKEWREPGTKPILFGMDSCVFSKPLVITEGECFPGDAEILTETGWIKFSEYDGLSRVCQVRDDMTGEFVKPLALIQKPYDGDLLEVNVGGNYTSVTTPRHNIVCRKINGQIVKVKANEIKACTGWNIPTTIQLNGPGIPLSNDQIALYLAVSADCTIDIRDSGVRHCRFGVKKSRKYVRMKQILDNLHIPYHDSGLLDNGYRYIGFCTPDYIVDKRLPMSWVTDATVQQRIFILNEMVHWDGNYVVGRNQTEFSSSVYENALVIQSLAHTCGIMSTIMKRSTKYVYKGEVRYGITYKVSVLWGKTYVSIQRWIPSTVVHTGKVYCVSVPTGMIMVRQSGHITVSGNCDAMSLYEAGIRNVVSVPSGCEDLTWVETCYDWLEKFKTIILFGDNDEPGQKMVKTVTKRLDESRCKIVEEYPLRPNGTPCKDANEILYFCGEFALIDAVENARDIPVKGLLNLGEVVPTDPTLIPRIRTNIPKLDAMTGGLLEGGITIVLGKAGSGKSVLSNMIALNAIEQGYTVCVYTGEFRADRFQYWINLQAAGSDYIGLKYDPVKDKKVPILPYSVQERVMQWYNGKLLLYDNDEAFDGSQGDAIINVFTMAVRRHGAKLLICDNLMTMCADQEDEWRAQAIFANKLKKFATRYGVAILLVAHARKTKVGEKLNADDLSGASATNNLADVTMSVQQGSINILKNRDTGILGTIEFCYCPDSKRLYQADTGDRMHLSWDRTGITPPSPLANSLPEYQVVPPMPSQPF